MEIQVKKRQKCLNIDYDNVNDKLTVNPMKLLDENEETFKGNCYYYFYIVIIIMIIIIMIIIIIIIIIIRYRDDD
jgi:heme/copper-type cytochrome/quinol oxidase subunit 2